MKVLVGTLVFAVVSGLAAAQSPGGGSQRMPQGSTQQPSTRQSAQTPGTAAPVQKQPVKTEKKLKGCIQSEGGKYLLKEDHGKTVALGGSQELPSHLGHTVTVHGNYMSNAATGNAATSSGSSAAFMVSKIDLVSDTCNAGQVDKGMKAPENGKPSPGHK